MKEIPITFFDNLQIGQTENTAAGTGCTVVLLLLYNFVVAAIYYIP